MADNHRSETSHAGTSECHSPALSDDLEDAFRSELERIFGDGHWDINATDDHPLVLEILQACPKLAFEAFEDAGGEWLLPLHFLVTSSRSPPVDLQVLNQVYLLNPDAVSQPCGLEEELAIHMACWRALPTCIVKFLAIQYPEGLLRRTHCGLLPIHLAMIRAGRDDRFRSAALEIVRLLLELYPDKVPEMDGPERESLLEFVFSFAYRKDLVDFVLQRHPHSKVHKFSVDRTTVTDAAPALDLQQAKILSYLLPQLTHFECCPRRWTKEAFIFLMEQLQLCTSLESLGLRLPRQFLFTDVTVLSALEELLKHNNLRKICLSGGRHIDMEGGRFVRDEALRLDEQQDDSRYLRVLANCLQQNNQKLETLLLSDFVILDLSLKEFLSTGITPKQKLALFRVKMIEDGDISSRHSSLSWETSQCTSLTIFNCSIRPKALENLLRQFSRMPLLKHFACGVHENAVFDDIQNLIDLDITDPIVEMLDHGNLQILTTRGPIIKTKELSEALKRNTTLRHYTGKPTSYEEEDLKLVADVLEHHNTTLESCNVVLSGKASPVQAKISHYTKLNDFGRGPLRKGYLHRADLIEFLCCAAGNQDFDTVDILNVHYGLLRELPMLWCRCLCHLERSCGKKRKCLVDSTNEKWAKESC